jgi:hypothetical protein
MIKTEPHGHWHHPSGWEWDDLAEARLGARKANRLWMAVRLHRPDGRRAPMGAL